MARDLTVAWELLTAVTRARQALASARPLIWERARLPTAEHFLIFKATADRRLLEAGTGPDEVVVKVSLETHLMDGRRLNSCLDIVASPSRWRALPYITLADGGEHIFWEGPATDRDDAAGFWEFVDTAAQSLLNATMALDFGNIVKP